MQIGLNFNFPHSVSSCMGCIPPTKSLPASFSWSSPVRSSMYTLASLLPTLAPLPAHENETFLCSDEAALKINQLSWASLLSRAVSKGKVKRPRSALLKFRFVILLLILVIPLRILNFTITWLLQTRLPCPLRLNHLSLQSIKSKSTLIFNSLENTCSLLTLFSQ